jgi:predicted membrane protein
MSKQNQERINWLGVGLVVIGIAYLSDNLHWDFYFFSNLLPDFVLSWPTFLVALGVILLLFGRGAGLILILIGAFFLFPNRIFSIIQDFHKWWPALLILIGVLMLARSGLSRRKVNN